MSDEFIRIATQEITDEIASIKKILKSCSDDLSISKNSESIEKHMHKIKGLAPMMGKSKIGELAALNDNLLQHIIDGQYLDDIYFTLVESNDFMEKSMLGSDLNFESIIQKITTKYSKFLN